MSRDSVEQLSQLFPATDGILVHCHCRIGPERTADEDHRLAVLLQFGDEPGKRSVDLVVFYISSHTNPKRQRGILAPRPRWRFGLVLNQQPANALRNWAFVSSVARADTFSPMATMMMFASNSSSCFRPSVRLKDHRSQGTSQGHRGHTNLFVSVLKIKRTCMETVLQIHRNLILPQVEPTE